MANLSNAVANQAIQLIGDNQPAVTGVAPSFDTSPAGQALQYLYAPCVATVAREFQWDFGRSSAALVPTGNSAPFPWAYEYSYPAGVQLWQVLPPTLADANNPLPVNWAVGNNIVSAAQEKVIWTNLASAVCVFNNNPSESVWDPDFREAVVRLLASTLAVALNGKPDLAMKMAESGGAFEQIAEARRD